MVCHAQGVARPRRRWPLFTHVEHIVGQDRDPQAAIRLAKRMIVDGRMPTPEEAKAQLEREHLGEPFVMDPLPEKMPSSK